MFLVLTRNGTLNRVRRKVDKMFLNSEDFIPINH